MRKNGQMPPWLKIFADELTAGTIDQQNINIKTYQIKIILNRDELFRPFAKDFYKVLISYLAYKPFDKKEKQGEGICYIHYF